MFLLAASPYADAQGRISWRSASPPGTRDRIVDLAVDPKNDSIIYLAAPGGGVWKTVDGGRLWTPQLDASISIQACAVAVDPQSPDFVYLGSGDDQSPRPAQGVARSADGGRTWLFHSRFTDQPVCALAVDPSNTARIAAGSAEGLFLSTDSGVTWTPALRGRIAAVAFQGTNIVAAVLGSDPAGIRERLIWNSADSGKTWNPLPLPPNPAVSESVVDGVSLLAETAQLAVAVSYQLNAPVAGATTTPTPSRVDFYRTTDSGATWSMTSSVSTARPPVRLLRDPQSGHLVLAAGTLLSSADQGLRWQTIATATGNLHAAVPSGGALIIAGENGLELAGVGSPDLTGRLIFQLPVNRFVGVGLDSTGGVWSAGPAGLLGSFPLGNFTAGGVPGVVPSGYVAGATNAPNIYVVGNGEVYRSTDNGTTFVARTVMSGELRAPSPPLAVDPVNSAIAFVAGRRLHRTTDTGNTWTPLSVIDTDTTHVAVALAISQSARQVLYAATACLPEVTQGSCPTASRIWRTGNGGLTWTQMGTVSGLVNRIAIDPRLNNTIYVAMGAFPGGPSQTAGYADGGILQSTNGGGLWTSVRGNLPQVAINTVIVDPTSIPTVVPGQPGQPVGPGQPGQPGFPGLLNQAAQRLFVGTDSGVFVTVNGGAQWTDISAGLPSVPVTDLVLRQPAGTLVAATFGRGAYQTSVTGFTSSLIATPLSLEITVTQGTAMVVGIALNNISTAQTVDWQAQASETWMTTPAPSGSLRPRTSAQVPVLISAVGFPIGRYIGRVQIHAGATTQNVLIEMLVTTAPARMTVVSGDGATGVPGSRVPPFVVRVTDELDQPLPNVVVQFSIESGGGSLGARSVRSNADGLASTTLTLPPAPGTVEVAARSASLFVTFTALTVQQTVPRLQSDSVVDAVTQSVYAPIGRGSTLLIAGENLASETADAPAGALPTLLGTTRILLIQEAGEIGLPLFSVSPSAVRALVPPDTPPGNYQLVAELAGVRSDPLPLLISSYAPGLFSANDLGRGAGVFFKADGSRITSANAADRGTTVSFFATGLGPVTPTVPPGEPGRRAEPLNRTVSTPRVFFDSYAADVIFSGLAPGTSGRYLVTVRVPILLSPAANISVSMTIGGFASNRVTIPVR